MSSNSRNIEIIEAYLRGSINQKCKSDFEAAIASNLDLRIDVEAMAMDIVAIKRIGIARDNLTIARLKQAMPRARKNFGWSIAAMVALVILGSCTLIAPIYYFIISAYEQSEHTDHTYHYITPLPEVVSDPEQPYYKIDMEPCYDFLYQEDEELKDFTISEPTAIRNGNKVEFLFTMQNTGESAEIQMHTARARGVDGTYFSPELCSINGTQERIIENWRKDDIHQVVITVDSVPHEIRELANINFSFQSNSPTRIQKSRMILIPNIKIKK